MNAWMLLYAVSVHVVVIVSVVLVMDKRYDDGLIGRGSLSIIILFGVIVGGEFWMGIRYVMYPANAMLAAGFAGFIVRHAWRFALNRWKCVSKVRRRVIA